MNITLLVLFVPLTRTEGGPVESMNARCFFMANHLGDIGARLGTYFLSSIGRYYPTVVTGEPGSSDEWRGVSICPLHVLDQLDQDAARLFSGVKEKGPKGTIVGVGALGSALLSFWTRAGWGQWDVIDHDHVRPHNLVRHSAIYAQVGQPKVMAVADLANAIAIGGARVTPHLSNPVDGRNEAVANVLRNAELVVDASASLEYARWTSTQDHGRYASVFITPGGSGVLMMEDGERKLRLRTLEAQYYRAIISSTWGETFSATHPGEVRSGASCRDMSLILPNSTVVVHAATQSEQIIRLAAIGEAAVLVWVRDATNGAIEAVSVPTHLERSFEIGDYSAYLDDGLVTKLQGMREAALPKETGGVLLGYWDFNIDALVIVDALPAPADSKSETASFVRGTENLPDALSKVDRRTMGIVGYVGEWHSHPPGHSAEPSPTDMVQLATLAAQMAQDGLPVVSLIIGHDDVHLMIGEESFNANPQ